ncbi:uncharacterized protein SCHCODRAFT_02493326 [Schizophyllum commune H4-8]|nr:uncharacterized protein SCHCODRAFT_02493326 [Schizophyllum commune H4-8]KAI5896078.1 hypothetical protein SCHCODRAFT_02493326 [Schizophyllum commune H4-8]
MSTFSTASPTHFLCSVSTVYYMYDSEFAHSLGCVHGALLVGARNINADLAIAGGVVIQAGGEREGDGLSDLDLPQQSALAAKSCLGQPRHRSHSTPGCRAPRGVAALRPRTRAAASRVSPSPRTNIRFPQLTGTINNAEARVAVLPDGRREPTRTRAPRYLPSTHNARRRTLAILLGESLPSLSTPASDPAPDSTNHLAGVPTQRRSWPFFRRSADASGLSYSVVISSCNRDRRTRACVRLHVEGRVEGEYTPLKFTRNSSEMRFESSRGATRVFAWTPNRRRHARADSLPSLGPNTTHIEAINATEEACCTPVTAI